MHLYWFFLLDTPIIPLNESRRFITECMEAVGTPNEHAKALADILVEADYRGHYSHGMNRLGNYLIPSFFSRNSGCLIKKTSFIEVL